MITALLGKVPHVYGAWVSRIPFLLASFAPEHGRSNRRPPPPRAHTTFSTESGPGVRVAEGIGPIMTQSAYWCIMSPSAEKTEIRMFVPFQPASD